MKNERLLMLIFVSSKLGSYLEAMKNRALPNVTHPI